MVESIDNWQMITDFAYTYLYDLKNTAKKKKKKKKHERSSAWWQ